jgi:chromosome segregation protein
MYLSRFEIIGFKSFAQRVNLTFDSGISAIVGPNGCGKTNIVDAIRWVLGEQRYSALRSERMEDVIFNGTKQRKPLGMAEASLVIENTKGILPSEYSEVTISRRVYRSGESEYLLNKTPCRLKDILDLFMDTGMGADAYSVIELKMVETILSDQADERRRLFEEAAGVTKYKHRRKAAYRKLESVQADLVRVSDIVAEVQKAVGSLERQARKAGQFNEVKDRLKAMEIDLMEREYAQLLGRVAPLQGRLDELRQEKQRIDRDLSGEDQRSEQLRTSLIEVDQRLAETRRQGAAQMDNIHRMDQHHVLATERIKVLQNTIGRFEAERLALQEEREQITLHFVELRRQTEELREREKVVSEEMEQRQRMVRGLEEQLDAKRTSVKELSDRTIALVQEIAGVQTARDRDRARAENLHGRAEHATDEIRAYQQEIERLDAEIGRLSSQDKELRRRFTEMEVQYYNAEGRKEDLKGAIDSLTAEEMSVRSEIERKATSIEFLQGLIESREGFPDCVRFLTTTDRWTPGRRITLADALSADEEVRVALETALGDLAGLVVVDNEQEAEEGIALLKQDQRGEATFVCLDRLPEVHAYSDLPDVQGVVGWAADLVRCEEEYRPLVRFILDRVLVVDTAETARRLAALMPGVRCVTLEGETISGSGITRGGVKRSDHRTMIGKQTRIDAHAREITLLQDRLASLGHDKRRLLAEHDALQLRAYADAVKLVEKEMSAVEVRMAQLQFEKKRAYDIIAKSNETIATVSGEAAALTATIESTTPALDRLVEEKSEVERTAGAMGKELELLDAEWNERVRVANDLGIQVVQLRGEQQNALNELERGEKTIATIEATLIRRGEDIGRAQHDLGAAQKEEEEYARALAILQQELGAVERAKASVEQESRDLRDAIHSIELKIKDGRRIHDDLLKSIHELELRVADLRAKADHVRARALEEYELSIELKSYPETEFVDFATLREEIHTLREKMKSLGNINFAAFEEYNTEKQRFEFLSAQRKDLMEAERTLLATIEEINATAQQKFLDTFGKIRSNFIETFKSLFDPGDECDLKLEEDVDPLEARIEITAKPRGKRPTSIDLLSGGEKTLTAIALLFAIYLVKPSPFCILDEVDAPLDDANIDRFNRILQKFSNHTQFIVVTHNKRTMEAANALYGVTMEEEGVSKVVSVRFNKGAEVTSAVVVSG